MTAEELRTLIADGERKRTEFKRELSFKGDKGICKEIAAFASTAGGTLVIGVDDLGGIHGVPNPNAVVRKVEEWISSLIDPIPPTEIFKLQLPEGWLVVIEVEQGDSPIYLFDHRSYKRIGSSSVCMSASEIVSASNLREKKIIDLLQNELARERITHKGQSLSSTWRPAASGTKQLVYLNVASASRMKVEAAIGAVKGIYTVGAEQIGTPRSIIVFELPACTAQLQQSLAANAISAAKAIDPTATLI